jgi:hypothetical protein
LNFRNRKGFIGDALTVVIFAFILGLTIMIGWLVLSSWNSKVQESPNMGAVAQSLTQIQTNKYPGLWDGLFGVIFIGMSLAAAISAYFIDTHPIVFALILIMLAVFIMVGAVLSNSYASVEAAAPFNTFASSFRLMHYILNHLGAYVLIEGALIMIALFTKARQ